MVFSSVPAYLDPSNWQQEQNHHIIGSSSINHLLPPPPQAAVGPPPPPCQSHGGRGGGSIRPGSMVQRARLANIPMPETFLKCPRCESTNTKFCYFNNYSLSQPRHFCKSCRRYWTRDGALRNVPVGGGCRRNKRTKSTISKSSPASSDRQTSPTSASSISTNSGSTANILGLTSPFPSLRFMSPLSHLSDNLIGDMGLNYSGISVPVLGTNEINFHSGSLLGGSSGGGMASLLSSVGGTSGGKEAWRLQQVQQFPFLGDLDPSAQGIYQFQGGESCFFGSETSEPARPKLSSSLLTQLASVKMEETPNLNISRELSGGISGNEQWNSNSNWTELSGFSSSLSSNKLQ